MGKKGARISKKLGQVGQRLKRWREGHGSRTRLPEELWAEAVGLARQEGLYRTARSLGLDYGNLKRRVEGAPSKRTNTGRVNRAIAVTPPRASWQRFGIETSFTPNPANTATPANAQRRLKRRSRGPEFVELLGGSIGTDSVIELEGAGTRMRIQTKLTGGELMSLVRDWREGSAQG